MTSVRQGRLAHIERRLGFNGDPCPVCAHRPGANRCMPPEEEAKLTASLDSAIRGLVDRHSDLIREVEELRNQ